MSEVTSLSTCDNKLSTVILYYKGASVFTDEIWEAQLVVPNFEDVLQFLQPGMLYKICHVTLICNRKLQSFTIKGDVKSSFLLLSAAPRVVRMYDEDCVALCKKRAELFVLKAGGMEWKRNKLGKLYLTVPSSNKSVCTTVFFHESLKDIHKQDCVILSMMSVHEVNGRFVVQSTRQTRVVNLVETPSLETDPKGDWSKSVRGRLKKKVTRASVQESIQGGGTVVMRNRHTKVPEIVRPKFIIEDMVVVLRENGIPILVNMSKLFDSNGL